MYCYTSTNMKLTKKEILSKSIREIEKERINFQEIMKVCKIQYEKYQNNNMYITNLMDEVDKNLQFGIPISIKDNYCINGVLTTCGSKMLSNFIPNYNATIVDRLYNFGGVNLGKVNMDEFAMGSSGVSSFFGPAINVWSNEEGETFSPGGSSSGSAVSVSSGVVWASFGSDTGGSVRMPGSWSGVVGFKPTYGVLSRYGIIPYAESFDCPGIIARKIDDVRYIFEKIKGKDEKDLTSVEYKEYKSNKKKFAILREAYDTDKEIHNHILEVEKTFINLGYEKIEFSVKELEIAISIYVILVRSECASNLQRYDGIKYGYSTKNAKNLNEQYIKTRSEGFGLEVQRRIMTGTFVTFSENVKSYLYKAQCLREDLKNSILSILSKVDFILTPTSFNPLTIKESLNLDLQDPVKMYKCDLFTVIANLCGIPAINVPVDLLKNGLPIGVTLMGNPFQDLQIMDFSEIIEDKFKFYNKLIDEITK
jgi:aspartyl-tRNA(Asn)/glutamyl-tRNA(Gln) amidotransferase subunit A